MFKLVAVVGQRLEGMPDEFITGALLLIAALLVIVAFSANPAIKALILAWVVL